MSPTFLSQLHAVSGHNSEEVREASVNPLENPEGQEGTSRPLVPQEDEGAEDSGVELSKTPERSRLPWSLVRALSLWPPLEVDQGP